MQNERILRPRVLLRGGGGRRDFRGSLGVLSRSRSRSVLVAWNFTEGDAECTKEPGRARCGSGVTSVKPCFGWPDQIRRRGHFAGPRFGIRVLHHRHLQASVTRIHTHSPSQHPYPLTCIIQHYHCVCSDLKGSVDRFSPTY